MYTYPIELVVTVRVPLTAFPPLPGFPELGEPVEPFVYFWQHGDVKTSVQPGIGCHVETLDHPDNFRFAHFIERDGHDDYITFYEGSCRRGSGAAEPIDSAIFDQVRARDDWSLHWLGGSGTGPDWWSTLNIALSALRKCYGDVVGADVVWTGCMSGIDPLFSRNLHRAIRQAARAGVGITTSRHRAK